jgi:hypothetical protein
MAAGAFSLLRIGLRASELAEARERSRLTLRRCRPRTAHVDLPPHLSSHELQ